MRVARTCHLCEAMCGLMLTVDGDRLTDIRGDTDDVLSRGHLCPKALALREIHEDPDRLRHPVRRTRSGWEKVTWDEALDEAAQRIHELQQRHGRDAIGMYAGNPSVHDHGTALGVPLFGALLRTKNRFDANSQDANPKLFASLRMFGELTSLTVPDVDRTDFFLILGANPAASNGSLMSLGDARGRIRGIRERGGRVVLVDPRRSETAAWADQHHAIRPGGDAALLAAMLHVVFAEGLGDDRRASEMATGIATLTAAVQCFSPERVAAAIGLDAATVRDLTRRFAKAPTAVSYGRIGLCQSLFGPVAIWLAEALNVVTGNFDRPGGSLFAKPAVDVTRTAHMVGLNGAGRFHSRVRKLPEVGGLLPAATMAEEMETAGAGQIRGLVTLAGNPVLSVPSGERLGRALAGLDFMVSIDLYVNETTRHAHLILPPASALERSHYDVVFHTVAVRNTAKWSPPVFAPTVDGRHDWDILWSLASYIVGRRAGGGLVGRVTRRAMEVVRPSPDAVLDLMLRTGPYRLSLKKLREAEHGIDLGPLVPMRRQRVRHPGGMVDLAPADLVADLARVGAWIDPQRDAGLVLIGRRHLRSNNSWMHNAPSLVKGPDRSSLMMNPGDASARGLKTGDSVRVESRAGAVEVRLEVTPAVRPGVVSLPHGFGHAVARDTLRVAGAVAGANMNAVTDDAIVEPLTGTAVLSGVPVSVSPTSAT
jgi:anaerobic selenocysteine-containing dehydrogenase